MNTKNIESICNELKNDLYDPGKDVLVIWYNSLIRKNEKKLLSDTFHMVTRSQGVFIYPILDTVKKDGTVHGVFERIEINDKRKQKKILYSYWGLPLYFSEKGHLVFKQPFTHVFDLNTHRLSYIAKNLLEDNNTVENDRGLIYMFMLEEVLTDYSIIPDIFTVNTEYIEKVNNIEKSVKHLSKKV